MIKKHLGQIILLLVVVYLLLSFIADLISNKEYNWQVVSSYLFNQKVISGVGWTLILTFSSMIIGIVLAITIALFSRSSNTILRWGAKTYIWFFRGTPIYTQLIFWGLISVLWPYISLGIPFTQISFFKIDSSVIFNAVVCAILGLALNEAAYLSEIVRAGLDSVSKGQEEAGISLGLSKARTMFHVILPQAMRVIIPPTGNETISMLKTTSLVAAVPFTLDLNYVQGAIASRLFLPIPLLLVACFWYLLITTIFMFFQYHLEKHFGKGIISAG